MKGVFQEQNSLARVPVNYTCMCVAMDRSPNRYRDVGDAVGVDVVRKMKSIKRHAENNPA